MSEIPTYYEFLKPWSKVFSKVFDNPVFISGGTFLVRDLMFYHEDEDTDLELKITVLEGYDEEHKVSIQVRHDFHYEGQFTLPCLFEAKTDDGSVKFIFWCVSQPMANLSMDFMVFEHGDHKKLDDWGKKFRKKYEARSVQKPILADGLLDQIVNRTVGFHEKAKKHTHLEKNLTQGVLLHGSPGNGKTLLASYLRHLCRQKGINTRVYSSSTIADLHNNGRLSDIFSHKGLVFLDDIDISMLSRAKGNMLACDLLSAMDGFDKARSCITVITTNENTKDIDAAFLRPGRIDKVFEIDPPTCEMRLELISTWHEDIMQYVDRDLGGAVQLAEDTKGFSFAKVNAIKKEIALGIMLEEEPDYQILHNPSTDETTKIGFNFKPKKKPQEEICLTAARINPTKQAGIQ